MVGQRGHISRPVHQLASIEGRGVPVAGAVGRDEPYASGRRRLVEHLGLEARVVSAVEEEHRAAIGVAELAPGQQAPVRELEGLQVGAVGVGGGHPESSKKEGSGHRSLHAQGSWKRSTAAASRWL
jgi:hypothetical protein